MQSISNNEMVVQSTGEEPDFVRDRIVILGRPQAGKTVYLSLLYEMLWNSKDILKMKSVKGAHHANLIKTACEIKETIESGKSNGWTAPTGETSPTFLEVKYDDKIWTMVALDYSGEVFQNAFIKDVDSESVRQLLDHIDHAQAVILLVDPEHVSGRNVDAVIDNNFGMLQAIERVQNWPDGKTVPVVLVLTKVDRNHKILSKHGGTKAFVMKYFPDLVSTTQHLQVCKVSGRNIHGITRESDEYRCSNLKIPVLYCLDIIREKEKALQEIRKKKEYEKFMKRVAAQARVKLFLACLGWLVLFAILIMIVILILPSTVWTNLRYNLGL